MFRLLVFSLIFTTSCTLIGNDGQNHENDDMLPIVYGIKSLAFLGKVPKAPCGISQKAKTRDFKKAGSTALARKVLGRVVNFDDEGDERRDILGQHVVPADNGQPSRHDRFVSGLSDQVKAIIAKKRKEKAEEEENNNPTAPMDTSTE